MPNAQLYVKGVLFYGKNEEFYQELKSKFFTKNLTQLKQKEICKDVFEQKNIFEYLNSIKKKNELIFIKFEPKESQTNKSKLNLLGETGTHETSTVYELIFKELLNQAQNKSGHVSLSIPSELENTVESFYLFTLNKKDEHSSDKSFLEKFSIKLVRDRDLIMGVVIRKPQQVKPTVSKRNIYEEMNICAKKHKTNDDSKTNLPLSDTNKVQNTESSLRDPRILKRIERESKQKSSLDDQKTSTLSAALTPFQTNIESNTGLTKIKAQNANLNKTDKENSQIIDKQAKPKKRVSFETADTENKENDSSLNSKKIKL